MIQVRATQPTMEGRLEYLRDPETEEHLIFLRSSHKSTPVISLNISGGLAVFGANEHGIITSLEINVPRKRWQIVADLAAPITSGMASLQLEKLTPKHTEVEIPLLVYSDAQYSYAHVQLGLTEEATSWVSLSENCLAIISNNFLTGLFIKLTVVN